VDIYDRNRNRIGYETREGWDSCLVQLLIHDSDLLLSVQVASRKTPYWSPVSAMSYGIAVCYSKLTIGEHNSTESCPQPETKIVYFYNTAFAL
jgi:hypothetical protein